MLRLADYGIIAGIVIPVVSGGVYVGKIDQRSAESSQQIRQHIAQQQEVDLLQKKWLLEERIRSNPNDTKAVFDLELTNRMLEKNQKIQQELEKERN